MSEQAHTFKTGDRVEFTDAKGQRIRGKVVAAGSGSNFRVVFQRGWTWQDGERLSKSDYAWAFTFEGRMCGYEGEIAVVHSPARATPSKSGGADQSQNTENVDG